MQALVVIKVALEVRVNLVVYYDIEVTDLNQRISYQIKINLLNITYDHLVSLIATDKVLHVVSEVG